MRLILAIVLESDFVTGIAATQALTVAISPQIAEQMMEKEEMEKVIKGIQQ